MHRLPAKAYGLSAADLAPRLIGCTLARTLPTGERLAGVIVETEAYTGPEDLASHAAGGRRTARNESMWAEPGTAYVYFTYGMHHCFNISCDRKDHPAAVLVRAVKPTEGLEVMRRLRTRPGGRPVPDRNLCRGPGRLCQAFGIDRGLDGAPLIGSSQLALFDRAGPPPIGTTPRVGLGDAGVWKDKHLRFFWADHPFRSRGPVSGGTGKPRNAKRS
ncbi:MAG: DNA-3-methyladenine glycosylase [Phycisphaerales bacterium]|nr:DNA-3-methyladenine glycosylase [Planctomycetota bacterium]MCH8507464.1 DNA-3-methyladenine glycosylase [Phycisphaerales bacterium]